MQYAELREVCDVQRREIDKRSNAELRRVYEITTKRVVRGPTRVLRGFYERSTRGTTQCYEGSTRILRRPMRGQQGYYQMLRSVYEGTRTTWVYEVYKASKCGRYPMLKRKNVNVAAH